MTTSKKRKPQQGCDIAEAIDMIGKAALTALSIFSALEPVIKAILTNGKKAK